ncbi:hypothetical protein DITRI_Ditri09bG0096200 [Diplodiscus trichospermus]
MWRSWILCSAFRLLKLQIRHQKRELSLVGLNPAAGEVKFNVDGASLGKPGQTGIRGVLRDHQGNVIIRFSRSVGVADSNLAELMAVRKAFILFLSCSRLYNYILNIKRVTLKMLSIGFLSHIQLHGDVIKLQIAWLRRESTYLMA